jgi:malonyl-CoA/methylmalonyl-CoA synthetase
MSNLYAALQAALLRRPDAIVLETPDRAWTAAALDAWVARYAAALAQLGLGAGDRIAVQIEKSADNIALYLAALRVGAIYVPLNSAYQPREIEYFLNDATPRVFVAAPERLDALQSLASNAGVEHIVTLGTSSDGSLAALVDASPSDDTIVERADTDLAVICYTSGTTGRSKGAMISHDNLFSNARTLVAQWGFTADDVLLHALPLYHIHGLFVALHCALLSGARILLHAKFDARAVLAALTRSSVMMGVPTFYTRLLAEPALDRDAVRNVRLFISGSAPLLAETFDRFTERTGQRILERYGMTETGMIASNPLQGERRPGTVGPPLPEVAVRIADENGCAVTHGAIGTVEVRGPNVFQGYWRMPDKTAQEFRSDGFFITGDLGMLEPDGYLRLVGRAKDMIISGGLNVYPKEIEELIDAIPDVVESAVFALPHPDFGEAVAAAVTLQPGASLDAAAILATLRPQLASFKTPKRIYVLDELPRNAMSKVQKALLRERYKSAFESSE